MRPTLTALAIALAGLTAPEAHAATTQQFFDLCGNDEEACAKRIDDVRATAEKSGAKFCPPSTMSREGYANEVTYWIGEQSLDMKQDDAKSIIAALKALYSCKPAQGSKP
jgi:hypothetical protein